MTGRDFAPEFNKHCVKSVQIRSFSGPYFPAFGMNPEIYSVNHCIHSKCEKVWTRKNSVFGHFSRSDKRLLFSHIKVTRPKTILFSKWFYVCQIFLNNCKHFLWNYSTIIKNNSQVQIRQILVKLIFGCSKIPDRLEKLILVYVCDKV